MAAKSKAAAATFTQEQVEAIASAAVAKALAALTPTPAPIATHGIRACDAVLVREAAELDADQAKYKRQAGIVEKVAGDSVAVRMDPDSKLVAFPAAALTVLKAN